MSYPRFGKGSLPVSLLLVALLALTACNSVPKRSVITKPPLVSCQERAPAEAAVPLPPLPEEDAGLEAWKQAARAMLISALGWVGTAQLEVQKRVTTAECIDAYNRNIR